MNWLWSNKPQRLISLLLASLVCSLLVNGIVFVHFQKALFRARSLAQCECPIRLEELRGLVATWSGGESGRLPSNLDFVSAAFKMTANKRELRLHPLLCPSSQTSVIGERVSANSSDYIYVDYSKEFTNWASLPKEYPLFYDRRYANHGGTGVYVMRGDGVVLWDRDALWLKSFVKAHPECKVQLPQ
jgi:hypothetical protein